MEKYRDAYTRGQSSLNKSIHSSVALENVIGSPFKKGVATTEERSRGMFASINNPEDIFSPSKTGLIRKSF